MAIEWYGQDKPGTVSIRLSKRELTFTKEAVRQYLEPLTADGAPDWVRIGWEHLTGVIVIVAAAQGHKGALALRKDRRGWGGMRVTVGGFIRQFNLAGRVDSQLHGRLGVLKKSLVLTFQPPRPDLGNTPAPAAAIDPPAEAVKTPKRKAKPRTSLWVCAQCGFSGPAWPLNYRVAGHPKRCSRCKSDQFRPLMSPADNSAAAGWICEGCAETFEVRPEQCHKCQGISFSPVTDTRAQKRQRLEAVQ